MHKQQSALLPFVNENSLVTLKKSAILVDKIALVFLTGIPRARRARFPLSIAYYNKEQIQRITSELNWLYDNDVLDSPVSDPSPSGWEMEDFDRESNTCVVRTSSGTIFFQPGNTPIEDYIFQQTLKSLIYEESPIAVLKNLRNPFYESPVIISSQAVNRNTFNYPKKNSSLVLDVLLSAVPQPSIDTPWDAIIDWRNDDEAQVKFRRLKNWMNKISLQEEINTNHLFDEISYLLDEYQQYMKIQKIKFSAGIVRTLVTTGADVLESLTKLNFKAIAEMPFKMNDARVALKEAELKAPGRELAFIIDAQRKISSD